MLIAYLSTITLLPALLKVLNPPGEKEPLGYASLAPVDHFMERHRIAIIVGTAVVVLGGLPLLYNLRFDFNPINLNSPKVESIATYLELRSDPATGASTIEVLAPSLAAAKQDGGAHRQAAGGLARDDHRELRAGRSAAEARGDREGRQGARATLAQTPRPPPTDAESVTALQSGADTLGQVIGSQNGPGAVAAKRLARCADAARQIRPGHAGEGARRVRRAAQGRARRIARASLQAEPITDMTLPAD